MGAAVVAMQDAFVIAYRMRRNRTESLSTEAVAYRLGLSDR
jgi:hypothetical protein